MPKAARAAAEQEFGAWEQLGVEGHFHGPSPWMHYHETLTEATARLVGAQPVEVVVMNNLTVNLHLLLVSFYRPTPTRYKILMEGGAFPSDQYAIESQARLHGLDPAEAIVELVPRPGEHTLRTEDIEAKIAELGDSLATVLIGGVNYYTGQAFDMAAITQAGHAVGASWASTWPTRPATWSCTCTTGTWTLPAGAPTSTSTRAPAAPRACMCTSGLPTGPTWCAWPAGGATTPPTGFR